MLSFGGIKSNTIKSTLITYSGNIISAASAFVVGVVLARKLGPDSYGRLSTILLVMNTMIQLSDFGTSKTVIRMAAGHQEFGIFKNEVYLFALYFRSLCSFILALVTYVMAETIASFFINISIDLFFIELCSAGVFLGAIAQTYVSMLQEKEEFKHATMNKSLVAIIKMFLILVVAFIGILDIKNVLYVILISILIGLIHSIICNSGTVNYHHFISRVSLLKILKYIKWIAFLQVSGIILMNCPGIILSKVSTNVQVGYYYAAFNISLGLSMLSESIMTVLMPKLSRENNIDTIKTHLTVYKKYINSLGLILILLSVLSKPLVTLIYGEKYESIYLIFIILSISAFVDISVMPYSVLIYKIKNIGLIKYEVVVKIAIFAIVGYPATIHYGALGMAFTLLLATMMMALFRYMVVKRNYLHEQS